MTPHQGRALFRSEALEGRSARLHGSVSIATPVAWQVVGYLLLSVVAATAVFLASASYARVETVPGSVVLDKGVAAVLPSRPGVVSAVAVREGQRVRTGDVLVRIRSEEDTAGGATAPERIRASLDEQDRRLRAQGSLIVKAASDDADRMREQVRGLRAEITRIDEQLDDQRRLVGTASSEFADARRIADEGFISKRDLETREATLLSRRQQLSQLEQQRSTRQAEIAQDERAILQAGSAAEAQRSSTLSERAALSQHIAEAELARGYVIRSRMDGIATAVTARVGLPGATDQPLMLVVPARATPRAELYVPSSAAGFLAEGEEVRLALDAFPYERFGTLPGRILSVSTAAVTRQTALGPVPAYIVSADIPDGAIRAFGRRRPVLPGMTLTARIVTERRSLLQWLFEPLFAVRNR